MKNLMVLLTGVCVILAGDALGQDIHTWEMKELSFTAENSYENPYTEVILWVDLTGPGFNKRVYGFWDGEQTYKVRVVATTPGEWEWTSGSNHTGDAGLQGSQVGKIDIFDTCAFVAVHRDVAKAALLKLTEGKMKGRSFRVRRL